jgi:hypothetical protein
VVQHLNPKHDSLMAELLNKYAKFPVIQVEDGMRMPIDRFFSSLVEDQQEGRSPSCSPAQPPTTPVMAACPAVRWRRMTWTTSCR